MWVINSGLLPCCGKTIDWQGQKEIHFLLDLRQNNVNLYAKEVFLLTFAIVWWLWVAIFGGIGHCAHSGRLQHHPTVEEVDPSVGPRRVVACRELTHANWPMPPRIATQSHHTTAKVSEKYFFFIQIDIILQLTGKANSIQLTDWFWYTQMEK